MTAASFGVLAALAWRNVWRNRRRSGITILSIACGLAAILFGQSLSKTIQYQMIQKATAVFTGHVQILHRDVKDMKFPEELIEDPDAAARAIEGVANIAAYQRRLAITGLASSKTESAGILIVGVEPEKDRHIFSMHTYLIAGAALSTAAPNGIYLGDKLAAQLKLGVGGEVVLMASAIDGSMGAELTRIAGIYRSNSHTFDKTIAYVPLETAQRLLAADDRVNSFVFKLKDYRQLRRTQAALAQALRDQPLQVVTWEEVDAELVGIREYQDALMDIVLLVVFLIVALGILNTLLMSMFERVREFGVLMAIGARPAVIRRMIILEACMMGALGSLLGLALGAGLILYYRATGLALPIGDSIGFFMPFESVLYLRFVWPKHLVALAVVLVTSVISSLPPALRASRLRPAESLRHL